MVNDRVSIASKKWKLGTTQIIVFGFMAVILLGGLLLSLPISSADGNFTPFIDAVFTSTTSVCVTGLTTVATYSHWSIFGKVIILILIQLGGLGVICFGISLLIALGRRITMKERLVIQESYNYESFKGLVKLVRRVLKGTLAVELIGAVMYSLQFVPEYGLLKGTVYSIFHSISAFCNAGLDLIGDNSFEKYATNPIVNLTTIFLIVTGGIGFMVWWDIKKVFKNARTNGKIRGQLFSKLTLHSKLAISVTAFLIITGTLLIFMFEFTNPETIGDMSADKKLMASAFQAVTTRTAGILTIAQQNMRDATYILTLVLMFIGGSPVGTAGGVKTTTVAMLFFVVISVIKGKRDTELFHRKISNDNIRTGLAVFIIYTLALFVGITVLSITEPLPLKNLVFECVSAIATVGLGTGITSELSTIGKMIIICLMYIGRIGPITMAMAFNLKKTDTSNRRELAEKKIIVG